MRIKLFIANKIYDVKRHRKDGVPGAAMIGRKDQLSGVRRYWRNKRTRVKEKEGDSCRLEWMQQSSLRSSYWSRRGRLHLSQLGEMWGQPTVKKREEGVAGGGGSCS